MAVLVPRLLLLQQGSSLTVFDDCVTGAFLRGGSSMLQEEYRYIQVLETGAKSVVRFRLSISDTATAIDDVQSELMELIALHDCRKLVVDLSSTAYLPSSVIGILAVLSTRGIDLHLVNASEDVSSVMEVMGLNSLIHINEIELDAGTANLPDEEVRPVAVVDGYVVSCQSCDAKLSVSKHKLGKSVNCLRCSETIHVDLKLIESATRIYCSCPHCDQQLQLSPEWLNSSVKCEFCDRSLTVTKIR